MAVAELLAPNIAFQALPSVETRLRTDCLVFGPDSLDQSLHAADLAVRESTYFLEVVLVASCTQEVLEDLGVATMQESGRPRQYFVDRVRELSGLDPLAVVRQSAETIFKKFSPADIRQPVHITLSAVVRTARSVLESCPIDAIEKHGNERGLEAFVHRCRMAYDALRAFVLRNDPREQNRLNILGREYIQGALSVEDVATLLDLEPMDAVAVLEARGYNRPLEKIILTEEQRADKYARVREDRLRRGGRFISSPELVARDVVASERIEGVDARRWVKRQA